MIKSTMAKFSRTLLLLISFALFCCLIACGGSKDTTTSTSGGVALSSIAGSPTLLAAGQSSIITVKLTDTSGASLSGHTVNFSLDSSQHGGGSVVALNGGTTDAGGQAVAVYTAPSTTSALTRYDIVDATSGDASQALELTITASSSAAGYQVTLSADVTALTAGKNSIITATVSSSGVAAANVPVAFSFISSPSGAILTPLGSVTDAGGKIVAVYTAGATNPTADVQDTVEANVNSGDAFGAVIISRAGSASSSTVTAGYKMTVTANVTSLAAGQSSIITAKVTDSSGNPQQGMTVTFTDIIHNSGTPPLTTALNSGLTDASGTAVAVYTAGTASPSSIVQDTVQATVSSGGYTSTGAVIITRTAASASTVGYQMTLAASAISLKAGASSIITATVTSGSGNPVVNQAVSFSFVTAPPSGATFAILGTGTTDASGKAVAVYTAGATNPTLDVQDTFQASVSSGGYSAYGAIVLTRTGTASSTTVPPGYILNLTAAVSSVAASGSSVITATVTDGSRNPAGGLTVTFAIPTNNSGATWSPLTATTDAAGRAVTIYTAGSTNPTLTVEDAVTASVSSGSYSAAGAVVITRTAGTFIPTGHTITLTPTPVSLAPEAMSVLIAQVYNANGVAESGQAVSFGFVTNNSAAPALSVVNGTTDANGQAVAVYTAGINDTSKNIQDAVQATLSGGEAGAALITVLPQAGTGNRIISFTQTPSTSTSGRITPPDFAVIMEVTVTTNDLTTPVKDKAVDFSIILGDGTITDALYNTASEGDPPLTVITDDNGKAYVTFVDPPSGIGDTVIRAQIEGTTNGGDAASIVYWKSVMPTLTIAANPTSLVEGGASTITATLTDGSGHAMVGYTVTFALGSGGSLGGSLSTLSATTGGDGTAVTVLRAGTTPAVDSVSASATYLGLSAHAAVSITVTAP